MHSKVKPVVTALAKTVSARQFARHSVTAFMLIGVNAGALRAQADAGPMVLRISSSARSLSLANAGLMSNDADALFYNPALLFNARGMAVSLQRYGSSGTAGALASIVTVGSMNIGVGAQILEWSALPLSYRELTRLGATALGDSGGVPASSVAVTLGIARNIRGHRLGFTAKYVADRFAATQDGTLAFDVGMMGPTIGPGTMSFVVQNIGQGLRIGGAEGKLPTRAGAGWAANTAYEKLDIGVQAQLTVDRDGFARPAVGGEIGYVPIDGVALVLRNGLRRPRESDESFVTGGLGITIDRFSLDYAIEPFLNGRSVSHRLGLRIK